MYVFFFPLIVFVTWGRSNSQGSYPCDQHGVDLGCLIRSRPWLISRPSCRCLARYTAPLAGRHCAAMWAVRNIGWYRNHCCTAMVPNWNVSLPKMCSYLRNPQPQSFVWTSSGRERDRIWEVCLRFEIAGADFAQTFKISLMDKTRTS